MNLSKKAIKHLNRLYVFTLHGVYNTEFLLNLFEEVTGIQNHTIEVEASENSGT